MTMPRSTEWDLAGVVLERTWQATAWASVTDVQIRGGRLSWRGLNFDHLIRPGPRLLREFVTLASASDQRVAEFARRWGVLSLCRHSLPATHSLRCRPQDEPLSAWRGFARQARALLKIAAQLHQDERGAPDDWRTACIAPWDTIPPMLLDVALEPARPLRDVRFIASSIINGWLRVAGVGPVFAWRDRPRISLGRGGLFGALAVQLMLAMSRAEGPTMCSACGDPYIPSRRPHPHRRSFCPDCGSKGAAEQAASRDYRQRERAAAAGKQQEVIRGWGSSANGLLTGGTKQGGIRRKRTTKRKG